MKNNFFLTHPVFSIVLSIVIVIVGAIGLVLLPVDQYPRIVPPVVKVSASYPGADALTVTQAVATPIEQELNGTPGMIYMSSSSSNSGGFSALVQKGFAKGDEILINSIPEAMAETNLVCSSVNVASTKAGVNLDAIGLMGRIIKQTAELTKDNDSMGCSKLVVFANAVDDNPFMAGAFHGIGEPETVINVGVSGPGVVQSAIRRAGDCSIGEVADVIKKTAFKITRMGQLVGALASQRLGVPFGIVDLSLAPTPAIGDSVARILEEVGLEVCGGCGTTAILAMLNDAVKKGGVMASSSVGGLSGAFIPVSEDEGMIAAAQVGALTLEKLEAMTAVCSVGIDMVAVPGDTTAEVISGLIADEIAIGVVNTKTTAVRVIPAIGKGVGDMVEFGGLLGAAPIMPIKTGSPAKFINRGGRIPAPIQSLKN